jgi:hypothetical protein
MQYYFDNGLSPQEVAALIEDKCNTNDSFDIIHIESYVLPQYPDAVWFWVLLAKSDFADPFEGLSAAGADALDGPPF